MPTRLHVWWGLLGFLTSVSDGTILRMPDMISCFLDGSDLWVQTALLSPFPGVWFESQSICCAAWGLLVATTGSNLPWATCLSALDISSLSLVGKKKWLSISIFKTEHTWRNSEVKMLIEPALSNSNQWDPLNFSRQFCNASLANPDPYTCTYPVEGISIRNHTKINHQQVFKKVLIVYQNSVPHQGLELQCMFREEHL